MAKRTTIRLIDDLTGGDATETVSFSYEGVEYTIDLDAKNAAALRKVFHKHIDVARRIPRQRQPLSGPTATPEARAKVRTWARQNGYPNLSHRGSIRDEIVEKYLAARLGHRTA